MHAAGNPTRDRVPFLLRGLLLVLAVLACALGRAQTVGDLTNLGGGWMPTCPAGPYSRVVPCTGHLQTTVPLFSLKGPGRTSMSLGLYNLSNNVVGSHFPITRGYAGLGWRPTCVEYVKAGGTSSGGTVYDTYPCQSKAGNLVAYWYPLSFDENGAPTGYARRPGCRADLTRLLSNDQLVGFQVVEQSDRTVWSYTVQDPVQPDIWYLSSVRDPRGNAVTYAYDALCRVTRITDAAGRYATLTWEDGSLGQLLGVTLRGNGETRSWNLTYFPAANGVGERLKKVAFPAPSAGGDRPTVRFDYNAYDCVSDVYDPRGAHWHYAYGGRTYSQPSDYYFLGSKVVGVYEPVASPPASYDPENPSGQYDPNSPTTYEYHIYGEWGGSQFGGDTWTYVTNRLGFTTQYYFTAAFYDPYLPHGRGPTDQAVFADRWIGSTLTYKVDFKYPWTADEFGYHAYHRTGMVWDITQGTLTNLRRNDYDAHPDTDEVDRFDEQTFEYAGGNTGLLTKKSVYTTNRTYDAYTRLYQTDDPHDDWTYAYVNDRPVRETDPLGHRTTMAYDWAYDELTSKTVDPQTDPYEVDYNKGSGLAIRTNYAYGPRGELARTWVGNDNPTVYSDFDAAGDPQTVTDPAGNATTFAYDGWGRKLSQSGPSPLGTTSYEYDDLDRLVRTTMADGHSVGTTYDASGNAVVSTKEGGAQVLTAFDALDRPTAVSVPVDGATSLVTLYGYDLEGRRTSITNPRGKTSFYDYDVLGRLIRVRYPDGTSRSMGYDEEDDRVWTKNARGQVTHYTYDRYHRPVGIDYPLSADVAFTYRPDGLRTSMVDGTGTTTYAYDDAGRLVSTTQGLTGRTLATTYVPGTFRRQSLSDGVQTWSFAYDDGLRVSSVGQTIGAATPATYSYFPSGAVGSIVRGDQNLVSFGYDERGRITMINDAFSEFPIGPGFGEPTAGDYCIDLNKSMTSGIVSPDELFASVLSSPQQIIITELSNSLTYTYGDDGNVLSYKSTMVSGNHWTTTYAHDLADRLVGEVRTGGASGNYSVQYAYDGNGNRTGVSRDGTAYPYGAAGDNDQFTTGEGFAFSNYDSDGNPWSVSTPNGGMALAYDEMGRVTSISGLGGSTFLYDGDGRRVQRASGGTTTSFLYDGDQVVVEVGGAGGDLYRLPGVGYVRGGAQFYETDAALGSSVKTTDGANAVVGQTEYDGFGRETFASGTERGDFRFGGAKGYANDDATGMQLLGARYYLPALGRFLTPDPIGHDGGLNLYAYCDNGPLNRTDPGGKDWEGFFNWMMNFAAGSGDHIARTLNSATLAGPVYDYFNLGSPTQAVRRAIGADGVVDYGGGGYTWGDRGGQVWDFFATSAFGNAACMGLGASPMNIMIGRGTGTSSHVIYQIEGKLMHGSLSGTGQFLVRPMSLQKFGLMLAENRWRCIGGFEVPIWNVSAASMTGMPARNCVTAALNAFFRGWGL